MVDNILLNTIHKTNAASAAKTASSTTPSELTKQFGDFLKDAMNEINNEDTAVQALNEQFIRGEVDAHTVTIASEKAAITLQLTAQIRNKVIEAYQDVMRMQM